MRMARHRDSSTPLSLLQALAATVEIPQPFFDEVPCSGIPSADCGWAPAHGILQDQP